MLPFVLTILLVYGPTVMCDTKASKIRSWGGSSSKDRNAFFALRSCHQILHGDSGEFFSPDYLCSNPPLWCNWTIKVPAGKRVHLQLEDFTPASTCHLKTDQIHLDESAVGGGLGPALSGSVSAGNHRILEKCWGKAEYTSLSGTTHVILLIPRTPDPPLRGFYGRFSSLGDGLQGETDDLPKNDAKDAENVSDSGSHEKQEPPETFGNHSETVPPPLPDPISGSKETSSASVKPKISYSLDQNNSPDTKTAGGSHFVSPGPISMSNEIPPGPEHRGGERAEKGGNTWRTLKAHSEGDAEGGREGEEEGVDVALGRPRASHAHSAMVTERKTKKADRPHAGSPGTVTPLPLTVANSPLSQITPQLVSTTIKTTATNTTLRKVDAYIPTPKAEAAKKVVTKASFKERTYLHQAPRNRTHHPQLPGEFLFEMSVEVVFGHQDGESWEQGVATLLTSLKNTIKEELLRNVPKSLSSKRIKRLSSGALFLLWIHVGEWQEGALTHRVLHAAAQGLRGRSLLHHGGGTEGVIAYISVTDVNECGTQLAQCDTNAECVNHFGTYACRCRPSYVDKSRTGPGGTVCIDPAATACSWSSPAILRGIYCICFLLSFLIALLLLTLAAVYRRRHQGAFLLRCQGHSNGGGLATVAGGDGAADNNNNNVSDPNGGTGGRRGGCMRMSAVRNRPLPLVPPTPPTRHPKEGSDGTGSLQPPPLRFGPLSHSDGSGTLALESRAKQ